MSFALSSKLLRGGYGPRAARGVLLILADHANAAGVAWPSVATIAERTGLQRRQVQTHLSRLIAAGYLRIVGSRAGGRAHSTRFQIILNPAVDCTVSKEKAGNPPHGFAATHGKTTVQSDAGKGAVHCAKGCSPLPERVQPNAPEATKKRSGSDQQKATREPATPVALPSWLPAETWKDFADHRKTIRKPLTPRATDLLISKLDEMRQQGNNPVAVVEQSIMNGWVGVFPLNNAPAKRRARADRDATHDAIYGDGNDPQRSDEPVDITTSCVRIA